MEAMDQRRLELYDMLKPTLGDTPAQRLVLMLPPEPETLATKDDLQGETRLVRSDIQVFSSDLKAGMQIFSSDLKGEMQILRSDLKGEMQILRSDFKAELAQLESTLTRRMVGILGGWTVLIGSAFAWAGLFLHRGP